MAIKNKSVFTFPQINKKQVSPQPTFWDKAYQKADEIKKNRIALTNTPQPEATKTPSIGDSYNKMVGQYDPDVSKFTGMLPDTSKFTEQPGKNGFYGSMSGLEGASMRLANAASQRTMAEAGYGSGLKKSETAQEYGLKGGLMGQEYGLKDISTAKEYGLKGGLMGQEYKLKEGQSASITGYSSPNEMYSDLREKREKDEKMAKQQYERDRRAQRNARQLLR